METYQIAPGKETHGYNGPLKVSYGGAFTSVGKEYLEVAKKYDPSRGSTEDPNDLGEVNVFGVCVSVVSLIDTASNLVMLCTALAKVDQRGWQEVRCRPLLLVQQETRERHHHHWPPCQACNLRVSLVFHGRFRSTRLTVLSEINVLLV